MKTKLTYSFFTVLFLMLCIEKSQAQVLWYGDPTKDYKESFYRLSVEPGEPGYVSVVNDPVYGKVWNVIKPSGSKRAELARTNGYSPKEGDKIYVGWREKITIEGNGSPGFAIFQLKSDPTHSQNYPVIMGYNGTNMGVSAYNPAEHYVRNPFRKVLGFLLY